MDFHSCHSSILLNDSSNGTEVLKRSPDAEWKNDLPILSRALLPHTAGVGVSGKLIKQRSRRTLVTLSVFLLSFTLQLWKKSICTLWNSHGNVYFICSKWDYKPTEWPWKYPWQIPFWMQGGAAASLTRWSRDTVDALYNELCEERWESSHLCSMCVINDLLHRL